MTGIKYLTSWKLGHTALLTLELHALDCWYVGSQVSDHCPLGFLSENSKLCLDFRLKGGMDLIANGSVTLDIWKFKVFVFWLELPHDKTDRMTVRPATIPLSLGLPSLIRVFAVHWMGSSGPKLSSCASKDSDQPGQMLIWVFVGHTCHFVGFVMRRLKFRVTPLYHLIHLCKIDLCLPESKLSQNPIKAKNQFCVLIKVRNSL